MTQYIAARTKNLLERQEDVFHAEGRFFPGLQDPETKGLYDHPEDSVRTFRGAKTDLERGLIIMVHAEVSDSKVKKPKKPKLMFGLPKYIREFSWDNWYSRPAGHYA
jgi:hypothetical protein